MKANKRDRIVKVRLTNLEYGELTKASKSSKCMSDYFRQRVFRKGVGLIDPKGVSPTFTTNVTLR